MDDTHDFLDRLVGEWLLTGQMGAISLRQEVIGRWTLGGTFLRLYFTASTPPGNPTADYEAVYYIGFNEEEDCYVMYLLDTTEVPTEAVAGVGRREGNVIPFLFQYGDTPFTNTLSWDPARDAWHFRQTYEADGQIMVFAEKEMIRVRDQEPG